MHGKLNLLLLLSLIIGIQCQKDDDSDFPPERYHAGRTSKATFDTQFSRGRCPERFFQLGDECVYFSTDGKIYSWLQAERVCAKRVARMLDQSVGSIAQQPNMKPVKGVRQIVLNTPEKTDIFRALYQEYSEQNYAVRLPSDYNTLHRCHDGQDDRWPHYCTSTTTPNATCYETTAHNPTGICLREVDCEQRYLRLACEFTLPGAAEITSSKFRQCQKIRPRRRLLPIWAWISIAIGGAVLAVIIFAAIFAIVSKSKKSSSPKKPFPEPRGADDRTIRVPSRPDPAREPMLIRPPPPRVTDTGYLQPRLSERDLPAATDNSANA